MSPYAMKVLLNDPTLVELKEKYVGSTEEDELRELFRDPKLVCLWCKDPIRGFLDYKSKLVQACDKRCAHAIGVMVEIRKVWDFYLGTDEEVN